MLATDYYIAYGENINLERFGCIFRGLLMLGSNEDGESSVVRSRNFGNRRKFLPL